MLIHTGLIRLQEILKHAKPEHKWIVRRLIPGQDNRSLLKALKTTGETRVILDCPADRVKDYLRQANDVNFFADYMVINYLPYYTNKYITIRIAK